MSDIFRTADGDINFPVVAQVGIDLGLVGYILFLTNQIKQLTERLANAEKQLDRHILETGTKLLAQQSRSEALTTKVFELSDSISSLSISASNAPRPVMDDFLPDK